MTDFKIIAKNISRIENRIPGYEALLLNTKAGGKFCGIIGITGSPGAGKSTIADGMIAEIKKQRKKVAVLCIDPSSPFNMGALLGDRIRMNQWYSDSDVYIRSLASRKSLGGLSPMIIEITEYIKTTGVDFILIETVGIGQSEIEIAGLADVTVLVLVPENGDEIQTMKSGVMEVAGVFAVNKSDRPGADIFFQHLVNMLHHRLTKSPVQIPVIKTIADKAEGMDLLFSSVLQELHQQKNNEKKYWLLTEKVYQLIQAKKMHDIKKDSLYKKIKSSVISEKDFNIFQFAEKYHE